MSKKKVFGFGLALFLMVSMPFVSTLQAGTVSVNESAPVTTSQTISSENVETDLVKQTLLAISTIKLMPLTMTENEIIAMEEMESLLRSYKPRPPQCDTIFMMATLFHALSHYYFLKGSWEFWFDLYWSWRTIYENIGCGSWPGDSALWSNSASFTNSECSLCAS